MAAALLHRLRHPRRRRLAARARGRAASSTPPASTSARPSRVELTLRNRRAGGTPVLRLRDPVSGTRGADLLVPPLGRGERTVAAYRLPTDRRGPRRDRSARRGGRRPVRPHPAATVAAPTVELTVYPHIDTIEPLPYTTGHDPLAGAEQPNSLGRTRRGLLRAAPLRRRRRPAPGPLALVGPPRRAARAPERAPVAGPHHRAPRRAQGRPQPATRSRSRSPPPPASWRPPPAATTSSASSPPPAPTPTSRRAPTTSRRSWSTSPMVPAAPTGSLRRVDRDARPALHRRGPRRAGGRGAPATTCAPPPTSASRYGSLTDRAHRPLGVGSRARPVGPPPDVPGAARHPRRAVRRPPGTPTSAAPPVAGGPASPAPAERAMTHARSRLVLAAEVSLALRHARGRPRHGPAVRRRRLARPARHQRRRRPRHGGRAARRRGVVAARGRRGAMAVAAALVDRVDDPLVDHDAGHPARRHRDRRCGGDLSEAWSLYQDVRRPGPGDRRASSLASCVALWVIAYVADWAAFRLWVPFEATLPAGTLFLFTALLGVAAGPGLGVGALRQPRCSRSCSLHRHGPPGRQRHWVAERRAAGNRSLARRGRRPRRRRRAGRHAASAPPCPAPARPGVIDPARSAPRRRRPRHRQPARRHPVPADRPVGTSRCSPCARRALATGG